MDYDFNMLERRAEELIRAGRLREAMQIYYFMADGDPSLDDGYLGMKLGECYEALGELQAARFWYRRAVEENSDARPSCALALERLAGADLTGILSNATGLDPQFPSRRSA